MPQFSLRLPSRSELELAGLVVIALLLALFLNERRKVAMRDAIIAARPAVEERVQLVRTEAPARVVTKYLEGKVVERVIERGERRTETVKEHSERPACPAERRAPTRYVGVALAPDAWQKPRISGGLTFADRVDLGGYYDSRYSALGVETRYRW